MSSSGIRPDHDNVIIGGLTGLLRLRSARGAFTLIPQRCPLDDRPGSHSAVETLYVRRAGAAHPDHRAAGGVADADRHFPRHPHPRHQRGVAIYRPSARPDGRPHHNAVPAGADDHRQRHRTYRGQFLQRLRRDQNFLPGQRRHPHRQRPGDGDFADLDQGDAARGHAAADPELQRLHGADRAGRPVRGRLHRTGPGGYRDQPGSHPAGDRGRRGHSLSVRRKVAADPDRSRPRRPASPGSVGTGRRQCAGRPEPDYARGHGKDRGFRICRATQRRAGKVRGSRQPADQDRQRRDGLRTRRSASQGRRRAANQHRPRQRQPLGAVASVEEPWRSSTASSGGWRN